MTKSICISGLNRIKLCQNRTNGIAVKTEQALFQPIPKKQLSLKNCTTNTNTICMRPSTYQYAEICPIIDLKNAAD